MFAPPYEFSPCVPESDAVVRPVGEIDFTSVTTLGDLLSEAHRQSSGGVAVDLSAVTYIDSSGLALLIAMHRRLRCERRNLTVFVAPGTQPDRVLHLGRFGNLLHISFGSSPGAG